MAAVHLHPFFAAPPLRYDGSQPQPPLLLSLSLSARAICRPLSSSLLLRIALRGPEKLLHFSSFAPNSRFTAAAAAAWLFESGRAIFLLRRRGAGLACNNERRRIKWIVKSAYRRFIVPGTRNGADDGQKVRVILELRRTRVVQLQSLKGFNTNLKQKNKFEN